MLARLFVIVGGLIVLALTVALVGPYFVDWSSYRADFEREASAILGRKVTVRGEATAKLLPFPSVTFSDVAVSGGPDGEPAMTAETFSMDAELAPLLSGDFHIFDMRLVRPKATIEVDANGAVDWAMRPSSPFDASQISIEKLTITEGQVGIRHAGSGRIHRLTEINTEVSAKSLAGPWRMVGSMRADGMLTAVTVNAGKAGSNSGMRLRIQAEPDVQKVSLETDGELSFDGAAARYAGDFRVAARRDQADAEKPASEGPGYRIKGKFGLDNERLAFDEFLFETGPLDNPYSANGKGFIDLGREPRFALSLDGAQVRFDEAIGADAEGVGLTLAERLAALQDALLDLPKPAMPGTVDVNLPAVVAGDTTVRDVRLSAEPADDGWTVKSLAATLPGRTTLEADGHLRTEGELGFAGSLLLAIGQPSGFAAWVSQDVDDAIRRLPAAGFRAKVDVTRERQNFADLELGLGNATFRGEAESLHPRNAKPSTVLKLAGGALDVDGLAAFASLFVSDLGAIRFADRDFDLQVKAGPLSAGGLTAETVDTAFRLREGLLEIDRLSIGGLAGATVSATGTIKDFPANPTGDIDASLVAVDLSPLIAAAAGRYKDNVLIRGLQTRAAAYPGLFEDARLDILATAADNDDGTTGFAVSAQGNMGGTALSATLSGNGKPNAPEESDVSLVMSGRNDDATALMALYGLPVLPLGMTGPGETSLSVRGKLSGDVATSASLTATDFSAGFAGTAKLVDGGMTSTGSARLYAADLEPWLMTAGVGLPGMGAGLPVEFEAEVDYAQGLFVLEGLRGTVSEGAVAGDINAAIKNGKPHLSGQLTLDELDLVPLTAMVLGEASVESAGAAWSGVPFQPAVSAPFSAELDIAAATLAAGPAATAYDAGLSLRLDDEGLRLSDLSAKLFGGEVTGLFELKNSGGTGLFTGQMKLNGADIATALAGTGLGGVGDISTALSASGKSVGGLVATLSGSGTAAFRSLVIDGVNPLALPQFIARADLVGKDIDAEKTASFASGVATSGSFSAGPAEAAFTVAGGVLRAPPLQLENAAASIEANLQADFNTGKIAANGTIAYRPGDEALVGSEPALRFQVEGPLGATTATFDSEPLTQFLTQRALEVEQARVEAMQAALLEKQRLRREVRYYAALQSDHDRLVEEWRRQQEDARLKAEAEAEVKRKAEEEARLKAEAEAEIKRLAEEKARLAAEAKAREAAEEQARLAAEEAERKAAEAAKLEAEAATRLEMEQARLAKEAAEREAAEAARLETEAAARREAEEAIRAAAEADARRAAEEEAVRPAPLAGQAPRPRVDVGKPEAKPQKPPALVDGFMQMLQGVQ